MEQSEMNKTLLIIKAHPHSLGPAEGFLLNRDWKVKSTSNLKEALAFLVQNQPQFVMISIDHPNRKVRNLPKVLSQALPVCVISFSESGTAASIKNLSDCASGYAIFHPVTGPAVERMVNKYYKDLQANPSAFNNRGDWNSGNKNGSGVIAIKGDGTPGSSEATQNFLASLMAFDGGTAAQGGASGIQGGQFGNEGNAVGIATGQSASGMTPTFTQGSSTDTSSPSYGKATTLNPQNAPSYGSVSAEKSTSSQQDPSANSNPSGIGHGSSAGANSSATSQGSASAMNPLSAGQRSSQSSNPLSPDYQGPAVPDSLSGELPPPRPRKSDGGWAPIEYEKKNSQNRISANDASDISKKGEDSLMLKGVRDAMEKACIKIPDTNIVEIEKASHVACILVESSKFSGYLIAATAKDQSLDHTFVEKIRTRLFRFLRDNGEKIEENESMPLKLQQVPFMDWAMEYADFLRKSIHEGNEIALAFFPRSDLKAEITESADSEMAAVHIDELTADTTVEFNVYIHLPRNNRYVLYTPCGGMFFNAQKERLVSQGVSHLHVLRMELSGLDRYRAQNFLNDKIVEFESKAQEKVIA